MSSYECAFQYIFLQAFTSMHFNTLFFRHLQACISMHFSSGIYEYAFQCIYIDVQMAKGKNFIKHHNKLFLAFHFFIHESKKDYFFIHQITCLLIYLFVEEDYCKTSNNLTTTASNRKSHLHKNLNYLMILFYKFPLIFLVKINRFLPNVFLRSLSVHLFIVSKTIRNQFKKII